MTVPMPLADFWFARAGVTRQEWEPGCQVEPAPQSPKVPAVPPANAQARNIFQNQKHHTATGVSPHPFPPLENAKCPSGMLRQWQRPGYPGTWGQPSQRTDKRFHPGCFRKPPSFPTKFPRWRHEMLTVRNSEAQFATANDKWHGGERSVVRVRQLPWGQLGWSGEPGLGPRSSASIQQRNRPMENVFFGKGYGSRRCQKSSRSLSPGELSARHGTRGCLYRVRGVRVGFAPETAQTSARRGASRPLAEIILETCHLMEEQCGQMSLAAGRLQAGCGQSCVPGPHTGGQG